MGMLWLWSHDPYKVLHGGDFAAKILCGEDKTSSVLHVNPLNAAVLSTAKTIVHAAGQCYAFYPGANLSPLDEHGTLAYRGSVVMQRSSLVSRAVHCMASVGGKAVALCKEQKDLAVLYGLMPLSKSEHVRANQRWLREALHPTLGIAVADFPINQDPLKEGWGREQFEEQLKPYVDAAIANDVVARMKALYVSRGQTVSLSADDVSDEEQQEE